jgi:hypothetical protein
MTSMGAVSTEMYSAELGGGGGAVEEEEDWLFSSIESDDIR